MKNKNLLYLFLTLFLLFSCAENKTIYINNKNVNVEPYGWLNEDAMKNDSVVYQMCGGNLVWSIIGVETVIVPIILTGYSLYEPVRKK
jgi:hypothetical protein